MARETNLRSARPLAATHRRSFVDFEKASSSGRWGTPNFRKPDVGARPFSDNPLGILLFLNPHFEPRMGRPFVMSRKTATFLGVASSTASFAIE